MSRMPAKSALVAGRIYMAGIEKKTPSASMAFFARTFLHNTGRRTVTADVRRPKVSKKTGMRPNELKRIPISGLGQRQRLLDRQRRRKCRSGHFVGRDASGRFIRANNREVVVKDSPNNLLGGSLAGSGNLPRKAPAHELSCKRKLFNA